MAQQNCKCGKPTHPLYGGRCEDCWAIGNRFTDSGGKGLVDRCISGYGSDEDSAMISNQGPQSKRWVRRKGKGK